MVYECTLMSFRVYICFISIFRYIEVFLSSADEVRAYGARMESGGGFKSSRGYRPTPYDRNDRYNRFGGRGRGSFGGRGELFLEFFLTDF